MTNNRQTNETLLQHENELKILFWNANGLKNKFVEFINYLQDNNIKLAAISETWLKYGDKLNFSSEAYKMYRNDRRTEIGSKGGVAIIIHRSINHELLPNSHNLLLIESIGIKIFSNAGPLKIFSVYFPGNRSPIVKNICQQKFNDSSDQKILHIYKQEIQKLINFDCSTLVCGDLNSKHQTWNCIRSNATGRILFDLVSNNSNANIVYPTSPTYVPTRRCNPSVLDLIISNESSIISELVTENIFNSDHLPIVFTLNLQASSNISNEHFRRYDFQNANWQRFKNILNRSTDLISIKNDMNSITHQTTQKIDELANKASDYINSAMRNSIPMSSPHNYNFSRIELTSDILELKTLRNRLRRDYRNFFREIDKNNIREIDKEIRRRIQLLINQRWERTLEGINLQNPNTSNSKLYRISKTLRKKNCNLIPTLYVTRNNETITLLTNSEKADTLSEQFKAAHEITATMRNPIHESLVHNDLSRLEQEYNIAFSANHYKTLLTTPKEIKSTIKFLKNNKAPGIDGIMNKLLKHLPKKMLVLLTYLFNSIFKFSYFPIEWKKAKIVAILKPGKNPTHPTSYRPISLLSSISKVFERIVLNRINKILVQSTEKIIPDHQFGFRNFHSTNHQVSRVVKYIKEQRSNQYSTGVISFDIEKAFDTVWHDGLIAKLYRYQLSPCIVMLIKSFLTDRKFQLNVKNTCSNWFEIPAGVPQGSCLSPTLYSIYVSDMPYPEGCTLASFADDTLLYTSDLLANDIIRKLESGFMEISAYFKRWKIMVNTSKTQAIFFSRKRANRFLPQRGLNLNNINVPWNNEIRYLGIYLDKKLTFRHHTELTIKKISNFVRSLYPFLSKSSILHTSKKLLL